MEMQSFYLEQYLEKLSTITEKTMNNFTNFHKPTKYKKNEKRIWIELFNKS
jgi:hypothetical protein